MKMMTDKEIIRALECCEAYSCSSCPFYEYMGYKCEGADAKLIGLIKRQQAEIDKLKRKTKEQDEIIANSNFAEFYIHKHSIESIEGYTSDIYKRAIKEFEERLIENKYYTGNPTGYGTYAVMVDTINKIAEQMVGADNV